jgi:hypothetical protein
MKLRNVIVVAGLAGALAASPAAAQRAHLGLHAGYNFDRDDALIGAQFSWPLGARVDAYPSLDYFFTDRGSALGFNLDLKLRNVATADATGAVFYVGGGLNMQRTSFNGSSDMDTGGNLFVGYESRLRSAHPFFEIRGVLHQQSSVQLVGGLNFTLY